MAPFLRNASSMGILNEKTVWLVDSDEFLGRLLRIKLDPLGLKLRQVKPQDLEIPGDAPEAAEGGVVIVSMPQPGRSWAYLMGRVQDHFPHVPVVKLMPMGQASSSGDWTLREDEHMFSKPLSDLEGFIDVIGRLMSPGGAV